MSSNSADSGNRQPDPDSTTFLDSDPVDSGGDTPRAAPTPGREDEATLERDVEAAAIDGRHMRFLAQDLGRAIEHQKRLLQSFRTHVKMDARTYELDMHGKTMADLAVKTYDEAQRRGKALDKRQREIEKREKQLEAEQAKLEKEKVEVKENRKDFREARALCDMIIDGSMKPMPSLKRKAEEEAREELAKKSRNMPAIESDLPKNVKIPSGCAELYSELSRMIESGNGTIVWAPVRDFITGGNDFLKKLAEWDEKFPTWRTKPVCASCTSKRKGVSVCKTLPCKTCILPHNNEVCVWGYGEKEQYVVAFGETGL